MKIALFTDIADNYKRYGPLSSSHDFVKAFAIIIMIIDHIGYFFFPEALWWRAVGRIGFPVWFFMAGYAKPSRPPYNILVLSGLMVLTDIICGEPIFPINALLSIFLCRAFVSSRTVSLPLTPVNWAFTVLLIALIILPSTVLFEYGFLAILFALCGSYCRNHKGNVYTLATVVASLSLFLIIQADSYKMDLPQTLFMALGTTAVTYYLYHFELKYYELPKQFAIWQKTINFLSRNSHYVYFIHFVAFEFIAYSLGLLGKH